MRHFTNRAGLCAYATLAVLFSIEIHAERYFTWVDENGRVQHTVINEEVNPLIKQGEKEGATSQPTPEITEGNVGEPSSEGKINSGVSEVPIIPEPKVPAPIESSKATTSYDITVINEAEFVDGDQLEKNNYVRPGESPRYFTWRDAEGRMINSPYEGVVELDKTPSAPKENVVKIDKIKISTFDQIPSVKVAGRKADGMALKILGIAETGEESVSSQISEFIGEGCCADLDFEFVSELPLDNEFLVEINRISRKHIFRSGKSAYELVLLPSSPKDYLIRFKTFINDEAFIPTFIYLDSNFVPLRIVTNISTIFTPENWFRYGYLEGIVDAKVSSMGEHYMLIVTTRKSVESNTVFVGDNEKDVVVSHGDFGSIELFTIQ